MITKTIHSTFSDIFKITSDVYPDNRGSFEESFNEIIKNELPESFKVCQENISISKANVARGLHWQIYPYTQAKFVHCAKGKIIDIFVDIKQHSPTFLKVGGFLLNQGESVYVPTGYAHGFITLDEAVVVYKVNNPYAPEYARDLNFKEMIKDIPELKDIDINNLIMSTKDLNAMSKQTLCNSTDDLF
jgi:dTDP-4-dehydrorhamnose 3,5-epimerase